MTDDGSHKVTLPGCRFRLPVWTALLALVMAGMAIRAATVDERLAGLVSLPLSLEFVASALWALLFAGLTAAALRGTPGVRRLAQWVFLVFGVYLAARWLLFVRADYDRQRLPFLIVVTALAITLVAFLARYARATPTDGEDTR